MKSLRPLYLCAVLLASGPLFAADPAATPPAAPAATAPATPDPAARLAARLAERSKLAASLHYQKGSIALRDGLARVALPENFRYLSPAETETLLTKIWRNPSGAGTLGMIVPAEFDPLGDESWAVVLTYDEDGYVKDDDAKTIDYTDLLGKMKTGTREASEERTKAGYPAIELIGWAAPPRYDAAAHKLYWAKEIKFGDEPEHTLNYNIRMLGRRGVLVLNAVATMPQLKQVEAATPTLLAMVDFQEGHRYADFKPDTDKVAAYGIAALVAGGIAAKAGLFKVLWVGILAFKKIIIIGLIALASYFKKFWAWVRGRHGPAEVAAAPQPPTAPPAGTA